MQIDLVEREAKKIAVVNSDGKIITDGQSALDFIMNIGYEHNIRRIAVNKEAIIEGFFDLSTGIAGEITQKFVNYRYRVAVYGDFSGYTSKALKDYIYECNNGSHVFFVADAASAIERLSQ